MKRAVPDKIAGAELASMLRPRVMGASVTRTPVPTTAVSVVWVDGGDEVLVHLDSIATRLVGSTVLVSMDLETDQTGRTTLVVAFAIDSSDGADLVAATNQLPRGNGILATRWGRAVQQAAWSALLSLASDHAKERGMSPRGFSIVGADIHLTAAVSAPLR
ncbi:MAG: hypothetical protein ABI446_12545 [Gemmatimonadaceae bacterium]